jgi:hypothetical protein
MTSTTPIRRSVRRIHSAHRAALLSIAITAQLYRAFNDREEARRAVETRWGKWGRK